MLRSAAFCALLCLAPSQLAAQDNCPRCDFPSMTVNYAWTIESKCRHSVELAVRYTRDGVRHTRGWMTLRPGRDVTFRSTSSYVSYYARMDGYSWRGKPDRSGDGLVRVDLNGNFNYRDQNFPSAAKDRLRFRGREFVDDATTTLTCSGQ